MYTFFLNTQKYPPNFCKLQKKETRSGCFSFRGQRWIRTTEVERQQIYSLPHLATLEFAQTPFGSFAGAKVQLFFENASTIDEKSRLPCRYFFFYPVFT